MSHEGFKMIDDLVNKFGSSAEQIIAEGLNLERKGNMYRCPNPYGHRNGDKNPSMSWVKDKNYLYCHACGENISIYTYYKNYLNFTFSEIMAENGIKNIEDHRKMFVENWKRDQKELTQDARDFIYRRGITDETIEHFKFQNYGGNIAIPYYKNNQLVSVKVRYLNPKDPKKKAVSVTGSKPYLFNVDNIDFDKPLIITEGEWDCAIVHQVGYRNVVSVGSGAVSLSTLFEQSEELFAKFMEIILLSDNDKSGEMMDIKFIEQLEEKVATVDKSLYKGMKDINDVFLKFGASQVKRIIESGRRKFDGEWDLEAQPYEPMEIGTYKFIPTGIESVDKAINDIRTGTVTLITGRSNAGKSTFVNQVVANAIEYGFKTYMVVGEGDRKVVLNKLYMSLIGYDHNYYDLKSFNKRQVKEPKPEALTAIQKWHEGKLKLYVKALGKYKSTEKLFEMIRYKVQSEKYDLVVLDNLMSLLKVERANEKNELQAQFIEQCHNLAQAFNCAVIVVLHPNKTYTKGTEMDFEQIAGSSDISNKADNILNVIRVADEKKIAERITAQIQVAKNRDWSDLPTVDCGFDINTNMFCEMVNGKLKNKTIKGWQKYLKDPMKINPKYIVNEPECPF